MRDFLIGLAIFFTIFNFALIILLNDRVAYLQDYNVNQNLNIDDKDTVVCSRDVKEIDSRAIFQLFQLRNLEEKLRKGEIEMELRNGPRDAIFEGNLNYLETR